MIRKIHQVTKTGSMKNLIKVEQNLPPARPNEVTISIKAIGLNFADVFSILGLYKASPPAPFVPGLEFAGEILAVGSEVKNLKTGDQVMGITRFGGYATALNVDSRYVISLPSDWSLEEGASFLVQVFTAYYGLVSLGNLKKGQTVLIQSAAGGVGIQANRIAKKAGAYTIGVVGNAKKFSILKKEGYDAWLVRSDNFKKEVTKLLDGRELSLVMEASGGKFFTWAYDLLASQGRLITYGSAEFTPSGDKPNYLKLAWKYLLRPRLDPMKMPTDNKSVMAFNLIWLYEKSELMQELLAEIYELHLTPPHIGKTFSFDELPQAIRHLQSGKTEGKVVVRV